MMREGVLDVFSSDYKQQQLRDLKKMENLLKNHMK
jgi:hypothetical protein